MVTSTHAGTRASLPRLRVRVLVVAAAFIMGACTPTTPDPEPSPSVGEELGAEVEEYLDRHVFLLDHVRAVVVVVQGVAVLDLYRGTTPKESRNVSGVTTSFMSTLVGIAVEEGLLSLDATLAELLPEYAPTMTPDVAVTTLHELLTMTGPFPGTWFSGGTEIVGEDWVAGSLSAATRPRTGRFSYSDPSADLVAAALARATGATGRSVLDYAREKLFDPLGIDTEPALEPVAIPENIEAYEDAGFAWPTDPQGNHLGSGLMKLRPDDMVRLGRLYLDEGRWEGRQVVPAEWVEQATTAQVRAGTSGAADGYGYLWWVGSTTEDYDAFLVWGFAGQLIEVVPELDLVVVVSTEFGFDEANAGLNPVMLTHNLVDNLVIPAAVQVRGRGE